ncbi:MAG: FeoB-associated Cys-rich membrane protein [Clostridiales bacterium]|nr:FeoB-associated Cys-rich membrane protein [Clostridiales bacterium]
MRIVDIVALVLIGLLAWRAVARVRKANRQGCAGGCAGCAMSGACSKEPVKEKKPKT